MSQGLDLSLLLPVIGLIFTVVSKLLHLYSTIDKTLLFKMLSRLVITFLPRSKCLLILWLQSPSAVILEPKKLSEPLFPHLFAMK